MATARARAVNWKDFQERRATDAELSQWFDRADPYYGIGIVAGVVSGGLLVFDFEQGPRSTSGR